MNNNSMNHMAYEEFLESVKAELERTLGEDYQIEAKRILKNNGVLLDGIIFGYQNNQVRPTIYLNEYYQDYQSGTSLNSIISSIVKSYQEAQEQQEFDGFEYTLDSMIDKIVFRVVNYEQNKELLQESPHLPFMQDLVIVFYCIATLKGDGIGSIRITNEQDDKADQLIAIVNELLKEGSYIYIEEDKGWTSELKSTSALLIKRTCYITEIIKTTAQMVLE